MSTEAAALLVGTILAVGALAFVLHPLFFPGAQEPVAPAAPDDRATWDRAIAALREIELDRASGKLSDADYAELKRISTEHALRASRGAMPATGNAPAADAQEAMDIIEARVRAVRARHRECSTCGVRPEPDAVYCSTCGASL